MTVGGELAAEAEAVLVARDTETGRLASAQRPPSGPLSSESSAVLEHLLSPLRLGPVELREPDRLDRAPDDARPRPPADGRLRRLPRGARARRDRDDRPRGDRRPRVGTPRRRTPSPATRTRSSPATAASPTAVRPHGTRLFVQLFHGGRELIASPPRRRRDRAVGGPEPALPRRAARRSRRRRSTTIVAGYARSAAAGRRGRARRGRALGRAQLPLRAVLHARPESPRRTSGPAGRASSRRGRRPCGRPRRELALGVRFSADSEAAAAVAPELAGIVDYVSIALGDSSTYRGSTGIVPPPPVDGERDRRATRRRSASGRRSSPRRASSTRPRPTG